MQELTKELKQEFQNYSQDELNKVLVDASIAGYLNFVQYLLASSELKIHANIHENDDDAFRWACENGDLEIIKYLLTSPELTDHANIHARNDMGLRWACGYGHLEVVKYLLTSPELTDHADIHARDDYAFLYACDNNQVTIVKYLLSLNDKQCIDFQKTDCNLDWAIKEKLDDVIIAMMQNLKNNNIFEYIACLPRIEAYNADVYEQVKKIEDQGGNPPETVLYL